MRLGLLLSIVAPFATNAMAAPVGTAISYQGDLQKLGAPITDTCDFLFRLYSEATVPGAQIGPDEVVAGISVTNGLFHVTDLDFGNGAFNGEARWLDLSVKCTGDANFIGLSPRQAVAPTPYALRATEGIGIPGALTVGTDGRVTIGSSEPPVPGWDLFTQRSASFPSFLHNTHCTEQTSTGMVFCFGGVDSQHLYDDNYVSNTTFRYDPIADQLEVLNATLPTRRYWFATAGSSLNGRIYCFGGTYLIPGGGGQDDLDEIVEYNPVADEFSVRTAALPTPRVAFDCVQRPGGGAIYCFGGMDIAYNATDQILEYNPIDDTMVVRPVSLPSSRHSSSCAGSLATGKIYCFGGRGGGLAPPLDGLDEIVEYDPTTDVVAVKSARLPYPTGDLSCETLPTTGKIYCLGDSQSAESLFEYDPITDQLTRKLRRVPFDLNLGTQPPCAASSATGEIYCIGKPLVAGYSGEPFLPLLQVGDPGDGTGALANTWGVFSSREFKTDIDPLTSKDYLTILDRLRNTEVVRFRYRSDPHRRGHLGVIAEDAPREILTPDGQGVSLAEYSAFLLASVRALDATVNDDARELNDLVKSSELLNRKNTEHESRLEKIEAILNARLQNKDGAE